MNVGVWGGCGIIFIYWDSTEQEETTDTKIVMIDCMTLLQKITLKLFSLSRASCFSFYFKNG